VLGHIKTLLIV